jgi:hypothetical protein
MGHCACIICSSILGHGAGPGSALWATAQILVTCYGPLRRTSFKSEKSLIPSVSLAMYPHACGMYPHAHGHISTCTCLCIQVNMAMSPHGHVSTCTWNISTCRGHSSEFCHALLARVENFIKHYRPQRRVIDHSAESHELHLKASRTLKGTVRQKIIHL